jgi:outer membrane receptor for ferrienterochelin and colicins
VTPILGATHAISPSLDVAGRVVYSLWDAEVNSEKNTLWEPEAHATWRMNDRQTLMAGGDYRWNEFERVSVASHDQEAYGLFLQHEWKTHESLSTMAALRYDQVEDLAAAWSPKLALLVTPQDNVRVRGSVGRGFHAPTVQELYEEGYGHGGRAYRFGNPDLDPEYSTTYTLGLEVSPAKTVQVLLNGFYSDVDDMIVPVYEGVWAKDPTKDVWRRTNIKNAEVYGGEAELRLRLGDHVRLEGGYTYTDNEDKDTGRQLPYRPGSSVYGRLASSHPVGSAMEVGGFVGVRAGFGREAWNWQPAAGTAVDDPDGLTTPLKDYTKLDAGVSLRIRDSYEAYLRVENILGEDIEYLDDSFTVIDGEPVYRVGVAYNLPLAK